MSSQSSEFPGSKSSSLCMERFFVLFTNVCQKKAKNIERTSNLTCYMLSYLCFRY